MLKIRGGPLSPALSMSQVHCRAAEAVAQSQEYATGRGLNAMANKEKIKALAYLRTSSAANVGTDKDSDKRQRAAIAAFVKSHRFQIVEEFCDPGVSGADPIETRPGFTALLDRIEGNGVRTVVVEDASRFARDLVTQSLAFWPSLGAACACSWPRAMTSPTRTTQ